MSFPAFCSCRQQPRAGETFSRLFLWIVALSSLLVLTVSGLAQTVTAPPAITRQPSSTASAVVGDTLSFFVGVIGQAPITYQWYKNNAPISGAVTERYSTPNAQFSDDGTYHVVVTNPYGSVSSSTVTVGIFSVSFSGAVQKTYDGAPLAVTVTTTPAGISGILQYSYASSGAFLSGPPIDAGFYRATFIANDVIYKGTTGAELRIVPVDLGVTFSNLNQTYNGSPHPVTAVTNPPGIPLTLEYGGPNGAPPVAAGTYTVTAISQNLNYLPSTTQTATLVVAKGSQSVAFGALPTTLQINTPFAVTASASSGLTPVTLSVVNGNATFSNGSLTISDTAAVTIRASQAGNANYLAATDDLTLSVGKQNQVISFPALSDRLVNAAPQVITATASSLLPVTLSIVSGPATLTGNSLQVTGTPGTVVVRAEQVGGVTYNAAPAVERSFNVTTVAPPVITTQPVSRTVAVGSSVTFTVAASGAGTLNYQWLKDGSPIGNVNSPTLTLNTVSLSTMGTFTVVVSNGSASVTSSGAVLIVTIPPNPAAVPPTINSHPIGVRVAAGGNLSLGVSTTGTAPFYFQWRKDGVPIPHATSQSYDVPNVQASAAGDYTVAVQNSAGTATSEPASITVDTIPSSGPPVIVQQPASQVAVAGVSSTFQVHAVGTNPLSYQWRKNGVNLPGQTQGLLVLPQSAAGDAGSYSALVTNSLGSVTSKTATLTSILYPTIVSEPSSRSATAGTTVTFTVMVNGTPPFGYQWHKDGQPVSGGNAATLTLPNVQASQAGNYHVALNNAAVSSSLSSNTVSLTVTAAPGGTGGGVAGGGGAGGSSGGGGGFIGGGGGGGLIGGGGIITPPAPAAPTPPTIPPISPPIALPSIVRQPARVTALTGAPVQFSVTAESTATLSYQWLRNGQPIAGATNASFSLADAQLTDAGDYSVRVTNAGGTLTSSPASLTVDLPNYAGAYFGSLSEDRGRWALHIRSDHTGVLLGYLSSAGQAFVQPVAVNSTGNFVATGAAAFSSVSNLSSSQPSRERAPESSINGVIVGGTVTGTALGIAFTGAIESIGETAGFGGYFAVPFIGASPGTLYSIIGTGGNALVISTSGAAADMATGRVDETGNLAVTTKTGQRLNLAVNVANSSVSGSLGNDNTATSFAGLAEGARSTSRLINLSVRSFAGTADQTLAVGFVSAGTGKKSMLLRGIGPGLTQFAVPGVLPDPVLQLFNGAGLMTQSNAGWAGQPTLMTLFGRLGAFPLDSASPDSALLLELDAGRSTVQVSSRTNNRGIALLEAYDADDGVPTARLVNLSARTFVGTGSEVLTIGFVASGNSPLRLLIRGVGPGLDAFGVSGTLVNPELTIYNAEQKPLTSNDDWGGTASVTETAARVGAFPLAEGSRDAAILIVLQPGAYTAELKGVGGATGVGLIEAYEVP